MVELRDDPPEDDGWLLPAPSDQPLDVVQPVRSPYPGSLVALREAFEEKHVRGEAGAIWQIGAGVDYGHPRPQADEADNESPYRRMIVFRYAGHEIRDGRAERRRIDGRHTARLSHAMRRALMSRVSESVSPESVPSLHGHHDGSTVQCAIVGLPNAGHKMAKGQLLGLALCMPDVPPVELRAVVNALPAAGDAMPVTAGPLGRLWFERLTPLDTRGHAWGLRPERWQGPARRWSTASPLVLDRFLKRSSDVEEEVRRAVRNSGLPTPERVRVSSRGQMTGAVNLAPRDTLRRPEDKAVKPYRHATIEFAKPVRGPVVIGSMRHYGLGLCVPADEKEGAGDDR